MPYDDSGHDAASDLPWDDDAPLPPFPLVTDPDPGDTMRTFPGLPKSATWPDHEELLALRELRRDLDRILATEGQPHADVVGAVSALVALAGPLRNEIGALHDRLRAALEAENDRLSAQLRQANANNQDLRDRLLPALDAALRKALATERALRERLEAVVGAARVLREDIRVIHEDDPNFAFCPICGAAEHEVGCTVPLLDEALASLQCEALSSDYP